VPLSIALPGATTPKHQYLYAQQIQISPRCIPEPLSASHAQISAEISPNGQIFKVVYVLNGEPLFVGKVQHADETEASRDVGESLLRIDSLQTVNNIGECERAVSGFSGGIRWIGGCIGSGWLVDLS
jgi:hypothetical protein